MLKVFIEPSFDVDRTGGVARVVEAQRRFLPAFDIEIVDDLKQAQVYIGHAKGEGTTPFVLIPLHSKDGSVAAWTVVSELDCERIAGRNWFLNTHGYAVREERSLLGRRYASFLHREILGLPYPSDGLQGDHINRDKLDNRRSNLRALSSKHNNQNVPGFVATSRFRGVSFDKSRGLWRACVQVDRRQIMVGRFRNEEEAADAAKSARRHYLPYAVD